MKLLSEIYNSMDEVQQQVMLEQLNNILNEASFNTTDSPVTNLPEDMDLTQAFEIAKKRLEAAQRAVPLVAKLKDPEQRNFHKSRIFTNMNRLQGLFNDIVKMIKQQLAVQQDTISRSNYI
jgi:hypothetical protein